MIVPRSARTDLSNADAPTTWTSADGTVRVLALLDARGAFFINCTAALIGADPATWRDAEILDPAAHGAAKDWIVHYRAYAICVQDRVIVVDTGVGPATSLASTWAPTPGRLPSAMSDVSIPATVVDTVVLTHLHSDHVGWAVLEDHQPRTFFPNARYVIQAAEIQAIGGDPDGRAVMDRTVTVIQDSQQLDVADGDRTLARGTAGGGWSISVSLAPGHTPGHQVVTVTTSESQLVIAGDAFVHATQLIDPQVRYAFESDPAKASVTRLRLADQLSLSNGTLAAGHLGVGFLALPLQDPRHRPTHRSGKLPGATH